MGPVPASSLNHRGGLARIGSNFLSIVGFAQPTESSMPSVVPTFPTYEELFSWSEQSTDRDAHAPISPPVLAGETTVVRQWPFCLSWQGRPYRNLVIAASTPENAMKLAEWWVAIANARATEHCRPAAWGIAAGVCPL